MKPVVKPVDRSRQVGIRVQLPPPARERDFGGIDVATLARYASRAARSLAIDGRSAGPDPT